MAAAIIICSTLTFIAVTVCFAIWMDGWLRDVDKQKYLVKGLKKELKKGEITLDEFAARSKVISREAETENQLKAIRNNASLENPVQQ